MSHRSNLLLAVYFTCCSAVFCLVPVSALGFVSPESEAMVTNSISRIKQDWIAQAESPASKTNLNPPSNLASILKPGSRGNEVKELQVLLQQLGYDITTDGRYGKKTQDAVADFQKQQGLPIDGRVGAKTWEQLQHARSELDASESELDVEPEFNPTASPLTPENSLEADSTSQSLQPSPPVTLSQPRSVESVAPISSTTPNSQNLSGLLWWQWLLGMAVLSLAIALVCTLIRQFRQAAAEQKTEVVHREESPSHLLEERSPSDHKFAPPRGDRHTYNNGAGAVSTKLLPESPDESQTHPSHEPIAQDTPLSEVRRLPKIHLGEELIRDLSHSDPHKRRQAIWELGQQGDSTAIKPLVDLMIDSDSQQRSLILTAVSEIAIRTLKPINRALLMSLQDESPEVRKNAIRDVTRIYDLMSQINQLLPHALDDGDVEVRETAQWAMNQLNRLRPLSETESLFNSPTPPTSEQTPEPPFF